MEDFLRQAFTPMENNSRKELRSEFIVPNTAFNIAPVKSTDSQLSEIQAHFLDAVGPLTWLLESITYPKNIFAVKKGKPEKVQVTKRPKDVISLCGQEEKLYQLGCIYRTPVYKATHLNNCALAAS